MDRRWLGVGTNACYSKTRSRDKLLLLSMKINDDSKYILHCKKAFSDILEGIA